MIVEDIRAWLDAAEGDGKEVSVAVMGERGTRRIVSLGLRQDGPVMVVAEDVTPHGSTKMPPFFSSGPQGGYGDSPATVRRYDGPPWKCDECLQGENTGPMCINCGGPAPPVRERQLA